MPRRHSDPERVLQRLDWTVIRRLDGLLQGDYRTLFRGFGLELAELREYQLTDDVRAIDWNVTARMQTPWVRLFVEDRDITAWFLLDMSPSVDFGVPGAQKRDLLVDFTAVLARLLTRHGNRVGALLFGGGRHASSRRKAGQDARPAADPGAAGPARTWSARRGRTSRPARCGAADRAPPLAAVHRVGFPQRAGMGQAAFHGGAAARDAGRPPARSPGGRTAGRGTARARGLRDGRADLRRHARPSFPETVRGAHAPAPRGAAGHARAGRCRPPGPVHRR